MIRFARTSCAKERDESHDLIRASINLAFVKSKLIKFSRCDFLNKTLTNEAQSTIAPEKMNGDLLRQFSL